MEYWPTFPPTAWLAVMLNTLWIYIVCKKHQVFSDTLSCVLLPVFLSHFISSIWCSLISNNKICQFTGGCQWNIWVYYEDLGKYQWRYLSRWSQQHFNQCTILTLMKHKASLAPVLFAALLCLSFHIRGKPQVVFSDQAEGWPHDTGRPRTQTIKMFSVGNRCSPCVAQGSVHVSHKGHEKVYLGSLSQTVSWLLHSHLGFWGGEEWSAVLPRV